MAEPERGVPYDFFIPLLDFGTGEFVDNPTIVAGDFKVSKDGGIFANLNTLPVAAPSGSSSIKVNLSAGEMTADKIVVEAVDQTIPIPEWRDVFTFIDCPTIIPIPESVAKILDILEGDHIERSNRVIINKKNTTTAVLDKKIFGSLLKSNVVIRTTEQP